MVNRWLPPNIIDILVWTSLSHIYPLLFSWPWLPIWEVLVICFVWQAKATCPEFLEVQGPWEPSWSIIQSCCTVEMVRFRWCSVQYTPNMAFSLMANKLNLLPAGFRVYHMPSGKTTTEMSCDIFNSGFLFTTVPLSYWSTQATVVVSQSLQSCQWSLSGPWLHTSDLHLTICVLKTQLSALACHIKGTVHPQWKFCHHLLTVMLFQTYMAFFLLCNTKEDIVKH